MLEVPRSFEVQCGSILIISGHPPAIVLELGTNCAEVSEIGFEEGNEIIYWGGGTVVASYIDSVEERWSLERIAKARIAGIDFYAKRARLRRAFPEAKRHEWINMALQSLNKNYPKPRISLT